jgi:hypothetical protein
LSMAIRIPSASGRLRRRFAPRNDEPRAVSAAKQSPSALN